MDCIQYRLKTPRYDLFVVASSKGLRDIDITAQNIPCIEKFDLKNSATAILKQAVEQLTEYFQGQRKDFQLPLDLVGTAFQKKVWQALQQIPYGQTVSYKEIARRIKNPKAVRAVGSANGKNPLCIVIPCHRVIASDGSLGGYSGGIAMKKQLLALESQYPH